MQQPLTSTHAPAPSLVSSASSPEPWRVPIPIIAARVHATAVAAAGRVAAVAVVVALVVVVAVIPAAACRVVLCCRYVVRIFLCCAYSRGVVRVARMLQLSIRYFACDVYIYI
jgi:hypothetical protein